MEPINFIVRLKFDVLNKYKKEIIFWLFRKKFNTKISVGNFPIFQTTFY